MHTPATGGEDYDGPSTAFEGGLHSSDGCDLRGVGGERSEAAQLLEQLLVENGRLCLPADLRDSDSGVWVWGETEGERVITGHYFRCNRVDVMRTQKHTPSASLRRPPQETVPWRSPQITLHSRLHPARRWRRHCPPLWLAAGGPPCSPASKHTYTHTHTQYITNMS